MSVRLGRVSKLLAPLLCALGLWLTSAGARAHPGLDEAKRLVTELEFDAALAAFQAAIDSGELTRAELLDLLSERTLVLHALHRETELVQDFVWLAALAPEHILDMRAPPAMVAMWKSVRDQARGPLGVRLVHEVEGHELRLHAELTGTVPDGVRTRIGVRAADGTWQFSEGPDRREAVQTSGTRAVYAQALGLGGMVVAEAGSLESPQEIQVDLRVNQPVAANGADDLTHRRRRRAWIIGASAAVVAAGIALTSYFVVKSKHDGEKPPTNLHPMVSF
jgi:hypothetical protein